MAEADGKLVVCPQCGKKYRLKPDFSAASFQCKECAATVPVKKEVKLESGKTRSSASKTSRKSRPASSAAAGRRGGRRSRESEPEARERPGRGGREKKNSSTNVMIFVGGLVLVVVAILFFVLKGGKEKPQPPATVASQQPTTENPVTTAGTQPANPSGTAPANPNPAQPGGDANPANPAPSNPTGEEPPANPEPGKKIGGEEPKKVGVSKWDPPADLGHLEETTPEERKQIDDLILVVCDTTAGKDSIDAKNKLAQIGKKAFPRVLGAMAKIRDTLTDVDSDVEKLQESSLNLCDLALREMDGYAESKGKQPIRVGTDKKYINNVLQIHYRRWVTTLKDLPAMPGPYDPSAEYKDEPDPAGGKKEN